MFNSIALVCGFLILEVGFAQSQVATPKEGDTPFVMGYLLEGDLLVVEKGSIAEVPIPDDTSGKVHLKDRVIALNIIKAKSTAGREVPAYARYAHYVPPTPTDAVPRLRIRHGCYWGSIGAQGPDGFARVPLANLHSIRLPTDKEGEKLTKQEWDSLHENRWKFAWAVGNEGTALIGNDQVFPFLYDKGVFSDYFPTEKDRVLVFSVRPGRMEVRGGSLQAEKRAAHNFYTLKKQADTTFKIDWKGPFVVCHSADYFFFVTHNNKIYWVPKVGDQREVQLWWSDRRREIAAIITDATSDKTYVFARDKGAAGKTGLFFELARRFDAKDYELTPAPAAAPPSWGTPHRFVEVLQRSKLIEGLPRK